MTYDGESISLTPSVGNWYSGCRSHDIVRQGRVIEAESWSQAQIEAEHRRDVAAKASFYSDKVAVDDAQASTPGNPAVSVAERERPSQGAGGFWSAVAAWLLEAVAKLRIRSVNFFERVLTFCLVLPDRKRCAQN
ncbi:DUF6527 family protein [Burkholderia pseudomallei]|uniref:DUF6527 family protein n=1 Tax=Burkholderia pseudomallei TaxID=28450 RepID=UPI003AAC8A28